MRLGLRLPLWADGIVSAAVIAERVGFDSLWVGEAYNRGVLLVDPFVGLSAAAAATRTVEIGSQIVQAPLRAPFQLASEAASVAAIAQSTSTRAGGAGRFVLGVGAGSTPADFQAMGIDFDRRFELLDRNLVGARQLLNGYELHGARLEPPDPPVKIPILIGGAGRGRWLRRAAHEFDGWIGSAFSESLDDVLEGLKRFRDLTGGKRAVAANVAGDGPEAADILAALAEAGFDDATVMISRHDEGSITRARQLYTGI